MEPFVGQILMVGFNFAPKGWALCNGQLLPINQNQALFSLLGTYYGGDGRTNFALPNLQGRVPVHQGNSDGNNYVMGASSGAENVTLTVNNLQVGVPVTIIVTGSWLFTLAANTPGGTAYTLQRHAGGGAAVLGAGIQLNAGAGLTYIAMGTTQYVGSTPYLRVQY